jgi:hypothetical protein
MNAPLVSVARKARTGAARLRVQAGRPVSATPRVSGLGLRGLGCRQAEGDPLAQPGHERDHQQPDQQPAADQVREQVERRGRHRVDVVVEHVARHDDAGGGDHDLPAARAAHEEAHRREVRRDVHDEQAQRPERGEVEEHLQRGRPGDGEDRDRDEVERQHEGQRDRGRPVGAAHSAELVLEHAVAPEREQHPRADRGAAHPRTEGADDRGEVERVGHAGAHVVLGEVAERCPGVGERVDARGVGAEAEHLDDHAREVEGAAEADRRPQRVGHGVARAVGLFAERTRGLEARVGKKAERRRQPDRRQPGAVRQPHHVGREALVARNVAGDQRHDDRDHEDHDQRQRDQLEADERADRLAHLPRGREADHRPAEQRERIPRKVLRDARALEKRLAEDRHTEDRDRREDQVGPEQRPAAEEPRARAERVADEAVDRAGVAELG